MLNALGLLEKEPHMCFLHIHAQSYGRNFEVLPEEVENAELIAEDAVSQVLLYLFDEATVDSVTIHFSSASSSGLRDCSIEIEAQCSSQSFTLLPRTKEYMELALRKSMCSPLKELFGSVTVDSAIVEPSLMETR